MLPEGIGTLHQFAGLPEEPKVLPLSFEALAVCTLQLGLVVKGIQVTDTAATEHLDDPSRPRSKMGYPCRGTATARQRRGFGLIAAQQPRESHASKPPRRIGKEVAT